MQGIKHLIECNCILPQLREKNPPLFHSFVVFSIVSDDDSVKEKYAQCNNCGIIHRVYDICKSEILKKEEHVSVQSIVDISYSIPSDLSSILASYKCDLPSWEQAQFIYENEFWGNFVVIARESEGEKVSGKRLLIDGPKKFKIEPFDFVEGV